MSSPLAMKTLAPKKSPVEPRPMATVDQARQTKMVTTHIQRMKDRVWELGVGDMGYRPFDGRRRVRWGEVRVGVGEQEGEDEGQGDGEPGEGCEIFVHQRSFG